MAPVILILAAGLWIPNSPACAAESAAALCEVTDDTKKEEKPDSAALRAFENFKTLAGVWNGANQEGVASRQTFRVIAAGSCVVQTTDFDGHPGQTMITMYHMDGDQLMLTHYCVAKNQPRMRATKVGEDSRTVLFTFLDGTNLPSRDKGHMDSASFRFIDADHFASKWTWYQDGKETWMEEFRYERKK